MLNLLLSLAIAIAPAIAFGVFVYWRDKFDKEPIHLLIACFAFGALACVPAAVMEVYLDDWIDSERFGMTGLLFEALIIVALIEEGWKFVVTWFIGYRRKAFNEPYDGITYAVMVSLGFATLENIVYVMSGDLSTGVFRMFTAVPAHVTFAVMMGYFLGLAKFKNNSFWLKLLALVIPVLFHGFYNFSLYSTAQLPLMIVGAGISLILGIILSFRAIHLHRKHSPFNPNGKNFNGKSN